MRWVGLVVIGCAVLELPRLTMSLASSINNDNNSNNIYNHGPTRNRSRPLFSSSSSSSLHHPNNNNNNNNNNNKKTTASPLLAPPPDYMDRESHWVYMYYLLMVFQEREGHVHVPLRHIEEGWPLGKWLLDQREAYKYRRRRKRGRGQQREPEQDYDNDDDNSSNNNNNQRRRRRRSSTTTTTTTTVTLSDSERRLEQIGVVWDLQENQWNITFQRLQEFVAIHGHCDVPQHYHYHHHHSETRDSISSSSSSSSSSLGLWINTQRKNYQKGILSSERQYRLESIGFKWDPRQAKWDKMISLLLEFKRREGHVRVPTKHRERVLGNNGNDSDDENDNDNDKNDDNYEPLGSWLTSQRKFMRLGTLSTERHEQLKSIGVEAVWKRKKEAR